MKRLILGSSSLTDGEKITGMCFAAACVFSVGIIRPMGIICHLSAGQREKNRVQQKFTEQGFMAQWFIGLLLVVLAAAAALAWHWLAPVEQEQGRQKRAQAVHVTLPQLQTVRDRIEAVGSLRSRDEVVITSEVNGRIVALGFNTGQSVTKGQRLVQLDDRQALADLAVAEARLADAQRQLRRAQQLRSSNSISQAQVDELRTAVDVAEAERQAARVRADNHRIDAPFDGVVGLRDLSPGAYIESGDPLTTLDDTREMELTFAVPERFLGQLQPGQPIESVSSSWPGQVFSGELAELDTRIDPLSRTLKVKALIDNREGQLRPGQFMSVRLTLREREALVVPEQAVLLQGDERYVFVAKEDNSAERRSVELGSREPGKVEILSGIEVDDRVVITAQDRLSSGDALQILDGTENAIPDSALTARES